MPELYSEYDSLAEKWATPLHTTTRLSGACQRLVRSHSSENHQILEVPISHDSLFSPAFTPES